MSKTRRPWKHLWVLMLLGAAAESVLGTQRSNADENSIEGAWIQTVFFPSAFPIRSRMTVELSGRSAVVEHKRFRSHPLRTMVMGRLTGPTTVRSLPDGTVVNYSVVAYGSLVRTSGTWVDGSLMFSDEGPDGTTTITATLRDGILKGRWSNAGRIAGATEGDWEARRALAANPPATVTFLDGSVQEWERLEFSYVWDSGANVEDEDVGEGLPATSPRFLYQAGSIGKGLVFIDRVELKAGDRIRVDYSAQQKFQRVVLAARGGAERILERACRRDTACIVAEAVNIRGSCQQGGQPGDCLATLVPLRSAGRRDIIRAVKEIALAP